jgi:1-acyl-sn-glycerol-3-phosphate acyltransferase
LLWRLAATGLSFAAFGLGALFISVTLFPLLHLAAFDRGQANRRCQLVVHLSFRLFVDLMRTLGVLNYEIRNAERLRGVSGALIVANHPTLIDVVFIVAMLPTTLCVVKRAAWSNFFLAAIMWATGYIQDDDPIQLVATCAQSLEDGNNLVIFPESTRSVPGQPLRLRRGAASIIRVTRRAFIPIIITCKPRTLSKGEKWYQIPDRRVKFTITIGDRVDPSAAIIEGDGIGKANRRINRLLAELFRSGIETHECTC